MISNRAGRAGYLLLSILLICASATSGSALTPNGPHPDPTQREVLLNGLPIVVRNIPGDRVAVAFVVRAGAMFDPAGKSGLASMTARLLAEGAGSYTRDRILSELQEAGATLNILTTWDAVWLTAEGPSSALTPMLDVLSLMVTAPRFDATAFEAVKKEYAERALARSRDADAVADVTLARALFGKHSYGRDSEGDVTSIASLTAVDARLFYEKFYLANGSALAIAGSIAVVDAKRLAKPRFGRMRFGKLVPATFLAPQPAASPRILLVDAPAVARPSVRVGFIAPGRRSQDAPAFDALAASLGSKLSATGARVRFDRRMMESPFVVAATIDAGDAPLAVKHATLVFKEAQAGTGLPPASAGAVNGTPADAVRESAKRDASEAFYTPLGLVSDVEWTKPIPRSALGAIRSDALTFVFVGSAAVIRPALETAGYTVEVIAQP